MDITPVRTSTLPLRTSVPPTSPASVDQYTPAPFARTERLRELEVKIERTYDGSGRPLDEGIKPVVVALQANGLLTYHSCEGHLDRGAGAPWVTFYGEEPPPMFPEIPGAKRFRQAYEGGRQIFEEAAARHDIPLPDLLEYDNWRIYQTVLDEAWQATEAREPTPEKIRLDTQNEAMRVALPGLLAEFEQTCQVPESRKIRLGDGPRIEIQSGPPTDEYSYQWAADDPRREGHAERLGEAQAGMNDFANFLVQRFILHGPVM